jgi:hypothetical protein
MSRKQRKNAEVEAVGAQRVRKLIDERFINKTVNKRASRPQADTCRVAVSAQEAGKEPEVVDSKPGNLSSVNGKDEKPVTAPVSATSNAKPKSKNKAVSSRNKQRVKSQAMTDDDDEEWTDMRSTSAMSEQSDRELRKRQEQSDFEVAAKMQEELDLDFDG